jgi:RNase P subunit RPR2
MAKKAPNERKLTNPEAYERINYLLHIATMSILMEYNNMRIEKYPQLKYFTPVLIKKELAGIITLIQSYVKTIREVSKKSVIRL